MATTISSGYANSPKKLANIADHGVIYGGRGLVFDGVSDYLDCGNDPVLNFTTSNFSISMWINNDNVSGEKKLFNRGAFTVDGYYFWLNNNVIRFSTQASSGYETTDSLGSQFAVGEWYNIVAVRNGTGCKIYNNGVDVTEASPPTHVATITSSTRNAYIGTNDATTGLFFAGKMADVKIFDTALTEAQIQELYLKPEQSAPLAVRDNLVAWYPMAE